jgi:oxygen-independent coproporphyrinogen III oxidase
MLLGSVLRQAEAFLKFEANDIPEVAIEVAPDTVTATRLLEIREAGFNRINLGVQSIDGGELLNVNRRYGVATTQSALRAAMDVGFDNVCVDLIYGLKGQTDESWRRSIKSVIRYSPETICAYALTLRPGTGFARQKYDEVESSEQYRKWDVANAVLLDAGYERQTHVRWAKPGRGGYLQKKYHWASETLIGFGAGARSYLQHLDTRNGYSLKHRSLALTRYLENIQNDKSAVTDGYLMDADERLRKAVILGLQDIDVPTFLERFGVRPEDRFSEEMDLLSALGLISVRPDRIQLSEKGIRHRDLAVQLFLSENVRQLVSECDYAE